jgi:hypothetical protein
MKEGQSDRVDTNEKQIITLHPSRRRGAVIQRVYYRTLRDYILSAIRAEKEIVFQHLLEDAKKIFPVEFDGNVSWYLLMVKLDLEARGEIQAFINNRQERLQILRLNHRRAYSRL